MSNITTKEINDNKLVVSKTSNKEDAKEYFGINVPQTFVGVENTEKQEIVTTEAGNIRRNVVEAQEIYNIHKQKHHCWLLLDLETGGRGWYPGAIIVGKTINETILYENPDDTSTQIETLPADLLVHILNMDSLNDTTARELGWYKITCTPNTGYIKYTSLINLQYHDPF